jgi:hypothetical protein
MADTTHTLPHVIMYCVALLPNTHSRSRATQAQLRAALRRSQHIEQELSTLQSKAAAADQLTEKVAALEAQEQKVPPSARRVFCGCDVYYSHSQRVTTTIATCHL